MSEEHPEDEAYMKPDGHRYERPDTMRERAPKTIAYAVLGLLVVLIAILIALGKVNIVPGA